MPHDLLPYAVLFVLLLLGAYIYYLAIRSRESALTRDLRKCEIALEEAERSLQNASVLHANEVRRIKAGRTGTNGNGNTDAKFRRAKSAFARLFHPDVVGGDAAEREIRAEMFKQYWDELERIEHSV
ncbi:MAG: hypothetical protein GKS00_05775 [Alphaproteobacteria bacterium]|nr:hypothetical protein [Alphaproteobacteria bacterium]